MTTRPNVLWISTHDINPHLGAYAGVWPGAEQAHTPRLDALAKQGIRFDNAYAAAPVCAPSRSSVITGSYPTAIGTMHMRSNAVIPEDVRFLPEIMREAGYYTTNNWFRDFQTEAPGTAYDDAGNTSHWRGRPDGAPFFAAFHGMITHESQIYVDDDAFAEATARVPAEHRHSPDSVEIPPYHPDTEVFRTAWARYLDLVSAMDAWVGDLLDELDADGLTDSTIVVFWSDHGAGFPRAKRWAGEAGLRVPLIIRWPSGLREVGSTDALTGLVDLAPTMLAACGIDVPPFMHGQPLIDSQGELTNPNDYVFGGRDRMDEQEDMVRTVRDARYRYIRNAHPDRSGMQHCRYPDALPTWSEMRRLAFEEAAARGVGEPESLLTQLQRSVIASTKPSEMLFDITLDPHETDDLAARPEFAHHLERLRNALDRWMVECDDLGRIDEASLLTEWRPGGELQVVAAPRPLGDGRYVSDTPGSRVGWTTQPPEASEPSLGASLVGMVAGPERSWNLLPVPKSETAPIWVKAWRPGFRSSGELRIEPPATEGAR